MLDMGLKYDPKMFPSTDYTDIDAVNILYGELKGKRLLVVDPSTDPITPKVVWMIQSFVQLTIHRVVDLFEALSISWQDSRPSVAFVLARAVAENAAAIYDLYNRIETYTKLGQLKDIHESIHVRLIGGRDKESSKNIPNILCAIDKADKKYVGFREHYDFLSEFAHPNYSGMHGLYGKIDRDNHTFHIDGKSGINDITLSFLLYALLMSFAITRDSIHNIESLYPAIWYLSDMEMSQS